ncbi:MAG: hypothetical protein WD934_06380 [Gemmatimonadales bacterium]
MNDESRQAQETLDYIRKTMESAGSFTAVSGWGMLAVGTIGLAAAAAAWQLGDAAALRIWLPAASLAIAISLVANGGKAKRIGVPLWSGALRKLAWVMAPALAAGTMLTFAMHEAGVEHLLPGTWLALYGAGVTAGGTLSIRAIRWMGMAMLGLGLVAFLQPDWGAILLAVGFGFMHLAFGARLVTRHGG